MNDAMKPATSYKRPAGLFIGFVVLAVLFGMLHAPNGMKGVGATVGLVLGIPISVLLAALLRRKVPAVAFCCIAGVALMIAVLSVYMQVLQNPIVQLSVPTIAGFALSILLPNDRPLLDPACCAICGYPIGSSHTCTECGAAVTPRPAP